MTIQINYEAERKLDIDYEKLASEVAEHILETENCPYAVSYTHLTLPTTPYV